MSSTNEHSDRRVLLSNIITLNTERRNGERSSESVRVANRWRERKGDILWKRNWTKMGQ